MKRIFVLSHNCMFGKGIEALLAQESDIHLVGSEASVGESVGCILKYRPDIVIINCDDPDHDLTDAVLCIIQQQLDIRLIGLSLQENKIYVCRGEQKQVHQLDDLLEAVRG